MWRPWVHSGESTVVTYQTSIIKRRTHLSLDAKEIIRNVFTSLKSRGFTTLDALKETSILTKKPLSTVRDVVSKPIIKRKKRNDTGKSKCLDVFQKDIVRRTVYTMYREQLVPTLDTIKKRLIRDNTGITCCRATLWKVLSEMGFRYTTINKRQILMESQRLRQWCYKYLKDIEQYRIDNHTIIYLDETWFDTHDTPTKGWVDSTKNCHTKAPSNKGKRITIIHAGSENGWVPNALLLSAKNIADSSLDYHEDTTAELFENWFKNNLLTNIPPNSVIVMDNASYHSRQLNKVPNSTNTKAQIKEYMVQNNMYFEETYTKKDLLDVLKVFNVKKEYVCDTMAENMGHTVLRLPPYYCVFNPIELMWRQVKSRIRALNTSPTLSASVIKLVQNVINDIPVDSWKHSVSHVIKVEQKYVGIKCSIRPIVIDLHDSDSETDFGLE